MQKMLLFFITEIATSRADIRNTTVQRVFDI